MSRFDDNNSEFPVLEDDTHQRNRQPVGSGLNTNNWAIVRDTYALQPIRGGEGRTLIQVDEYQSQRDCTQCHGTGHTDNVCPECKGTGTYRGKKNTDDRCTTCHILRDKSQPGAIGAWINLRGKEPCPLCNGLGSSSIVVPDESKGNTTTGNIIAISRVGIECVKVNDKVMFTNYSGSPFKFMDIDFRIIQEKDLLCIVKKLKQEGVSESIKEGTFADLENTGVPHV